ncbi:MAG: hypothetical protein EXS47_01660 [Candidatus Zambryskibacteria bacterium]|nr:hypothetical protein [Candidatus Zambryskibacteria bacterium]
MKTITNQNNYQPISGLSHDLAGKMFKDRRIRTEITKQSFFMFFHFYFAHYVKYMTAPFQRELFHLAEREDIKNLFVVAFRGSGKSTIFTTSYPVWAILGQQQKMFVLILCQTRSQAKQHMMNLRRELESNQLLKNDLGPFQEENDEWGSSSLVFSKLGSRITAASTEQSIRGLRHNQHRPDLIIVDDVEDMASTKTHEGRQKIYNWLTGEVIPAGDRNTRLIVVGNLLHQDSLLMHLKRDMDENQLKAVFKSYPLINESGVIAWPGKYTSAEDIAKEKSRCGNEFAWQREYLLHIVPDEEQVIHPEWIQPYDELPNKNSYCGLIVGVDLAISQKDSADYTAMISAVISGSGETLCVYILPNIVNRRITFPQTMDQIRSLKKVNETIYSSVVFHVEDVGYQKAVIDQLILENIPVVGIKVSSDKRSRLMTVSAMIQSGKIKFPRFGVEELIRQIVGFGVERHDDLVDAFSIIGHVAIERNGSRPCIQWI